MGRVYGALVHATRSGRANNPTEGIGTVNYCTTPGTTSYNDIIDVDGTLYCLTDFASWHAQELNYNWWSIALAQGVESDPITDAQHETLRWRLRERAERFGFPLVRIPFLSGPRAAFGVCQHMDTAQGQRFGKSDVGRNLRWDRIL